MRSGRRLALLTVACLVVAPGVARADGPYGDAGGFNSVLAIGAGTNAVATDLVANLATGATPFAFEDQRAQYSGISRTIDGLTTATLGTGWKPSSFREPGTDAGRTDSPRPGVRIVRDAAHPYPRVYGDTRADLMFGTGYATAQDRLFLMDVLRHTAEASTVELLGPSAAQADAAQLRVQDFSPAELRAQFDELDDRFGARGAKGQQDYVDYVAGINAFMREAMADPTKLPAEYPALGVTPRPWTIEDSLATAVLLISQFTSNGGGELANAELHQRFLKRYGARRGPAVYDAFRARRDPEAVTITRRRFAQGDATGKVDPRSDGSPDPGSRKARNAILAGPGAAARRAALDALPAWARRLATGGLRLPHHASNALLVDAAHSADGRPLAAMGPQVGYYTPQIFVEVEQHGGGMDVSGVQFPGAAPYVLIGHGKDFAWTGTTPNQDTVDTFAEELCNVDGSPATSASLAYVYKGKCVPFTLRDQTMTTPVAPTSPAAPQTITLRALRSVHGPITELGTLKGKPVAYAEAHATAFREFGSLLAFQQLGENVPKDGAGFQQVMRSYVGEENWFYVGRKDIAWLRSGVVPRHARGVNPDFPIVGTGRWDWRGDLPPSANPRELNPAQGFLASWNNKESPSDPAPSATWSFGPVHRQQLLVRPYQAALKRGGGKVTLADLGRVSVRAATADLRGTEVFPWLARTLGTPTDPVVRDAMATLTAWSAAGAQRRDADGDGVDERSDAIVLMDAWWPRLVRGMFAPSLGGPLVDAIDKQVTPLPERATSTFFFDGWWGFVQKDLRRVTGRRVAGWPAKAFCGRGRLAACRAVLTRTLKEAVAASAGKRELATCPETTPPSCAQIVPITGGAVGVDPFPFHNRGTFHQLVEVGGVSPGR